MQAKQEQFSVTVTDQVLNLAFLRGSSDNSADFAHVAAIEVVRQGDAKGRLASEGKEQKATTTSLYPNPVAAKLTVGLTEVGQIKAISIRDATGRVYLTNGNKLVNKPPLQVDVSSLKPGLYLLEVHTEHGLHVLKFIKQ